MLTPAQLKAREGKVTASFVPALMAGEADAILRTYRELIGDPSFIPEDFRDNWPVQFGSFIETFALDWHQRRTGRPLTRRGEVVVHPEHPWLAATLDAYREDDGTVIDCKACNAFRKVDEIISYYAPQLLVQRACTGADRAALLIVHGGGEPQEFEVPLDPAYEALVLHTAHEFWLCVENLIEPVPVPHPLPPPAKWRGIDLDQEADHYNWTDAMRVALDEWLDTRSAASRHEEAKATVKAHLPDDCKELTSGSYLVSRARNRAVTIRLR